MQEHYKANNVSRAPSELGDQSKWGLGDVMEFSRLLHLLEKDLLELKQVRAGYTKAIRELETAMLKGKPLYLRNVEFALIVWISNDAQGRNRQVQQSEQRC